MGFLEYLYTPQVTNVEVFSILIGSIVVFALKKALKAEEPNNPAKSANKIANPHLIRFDKGVIGVILANKYITIAMNAINTGGGILFSNLCIFKSPYL